MGGDIAKILSAAEAQTNRDLGQPADPRCIYAGFR